MEEARVAVVIEDEEDIRSLLSTVLAQAGFDVHGAANGADGVDLVREHRPLVTTLDVNMPGMDGFETAKRIRAISSTYIVMLSARTEEIDALQGLEAGADDYVAKPFRPRELRARIDAMLRRPRHVAPADDAEPAASAPSDGGWLEHHGLRLNAETHLVTVDDEDVELTRSGHKDVGGSPWPGSEHVEFLVQDPPYTAMGWNIAPDGLEQLLLSLTDEFPDLPLMITENGAAFADEVVEGRVRDVERLDYLRRHFTAAHRAMERGVDLRGYLVWSLLDNFEWGYGFTKRFGVVHVDYETQERTVKDSGHWLARLIADHSIPR